jgi:hypothetical protein
MTTEGEEVTVEPTVPRQSRKTPKAPRDFGPVQFPELLGLSTWQFERALRNELIPPPDVDGRRWSSAVAGTVLDRLDQIRDAVGEQPDVGAWRAAEVLAARFDCEVDPETVMELGRMGLIPVIGAYKDHDLYDGRALETFTDRQALNEAARAGILYTADKATMFLQVRRSDFGHLLRTGRLAEVHRVRSSHQRRREHPAVALYRRRDLDALLADPDIPWEEVRATPAGRPSPLSKLTAPEPAAT